MKKIKITILLIAFLSALMITVYGKNKEIKEVSDFLPKGYILFEKKEGDLNGDGIADCILIIKGTNKEKFDYKYDKKVDTNRRGIIFLVHKNGHYNVAVENYDCFSSENEQGGVYYAPILGVSIDNGQLFVSYEHGRYGYWTHTFRFNGSDFDLIGYDNISPSNFDSDYQTFNELSVNLLTKKELQKQVIDVDAKGNETFKETWKDITVDSLRKLSQIKDFDNPYLYK